MFYGRTCLSKWMQRPRALSGIVWSKSVLPVMGPCQACSKQEELQSFSWQFQKDAQPSSSRMAVQTLFSRWFIVQVNSSPDICTGKTMPYINSSIAQFLKIRPMALFLVCKEDNFWDLIHPTLRPLELNRWRRPWRVSLTRAVTRWRRAKWLSVWAALMVWQLD